MMHRRERYPTSLWDLKEEVDGLGMRRLTLIVKDEFHNGQRDIL
jgi:hypothetical protein